MVVPKKITKTKRLNESLPPKVAQYGPGIIVGAKNNFQKVTQFGFILFSVLIYYRGVY